MYANKDFNASFTFNPALINTTIIQNATAAGYFFGGWELLPVQYTRPIEMAFWTWFFQIMTRFVIRSNERRTRLFNRWTQWDSEDDEQFNDFYSKIRLEKEMDLFDSVFSSLDKQLKNSVADLMSEADFIAYSKAHIKYQNYIILEDEQSNNLEEDRILENVGVDHLKRVGTYEHLFKYSITLKFDHNTGKIYSFFELKTDKSLDNGISKELTHKLDEPKRPIQEFNVENQANIRDCYKAAALHLL